MSEDFSNAADIQEWIVGKGNWIIADGTLNLEKSSSIDRIFYAPGQELSDFEFSVDITGPTANGQNVRILFCADTDYRNFYALTFMNTRVFFEVWVNGQRPVQSYRVKYVDGDTYHVEVSKVGEEIFAYMTGSDGEKVNLWNGLASGARTELTSGTIGFSAQNVAIKVDNLVIKSKAGE